MTFSTGPQNCHWDLAQLYHNVPAMPFEYMVSDFHVGDHDVLLPADSTDQLERHHGLEEGPEEQNDD
ncbi:Ceramide Synthase 5 [Manis pentadactyla]|nr:Ceramide Synthase 5 [Manis pentadactyla]